MVREKTLYCPIVWATKGGSGVPKQRGCLRIIVLIIVQGPQTKRISCKGQASTHLSVALDARDRVQWASLTIRNQFWLIDGPLQDIRSL